MNQNKFFLVWVAGFIAFAAVSCWATTESLHLLMPTWPKAIWYIVTIGFFIVASLGTKLIVDSLNSGYVDYMRDKKGLYLIGGIVLVVIFWLLFSLPTNTHTFFYRNIISSAVTSDISTTRDYLGQIKNNTNNTNQAALKVKELDNNLEVLLGDLEAEIMNEANPGFGTKSKEILQKFAKLLEVATVEPLTYKSTSKQDRIALCKMYREKFYRLAETKANVLMTKITPPNKEIIEKVKNVDQNIANMQKGIDDKKLDLNNAEDMDNHVLKQLNIGYNTIKENKEFVNFSTEADKAKYTAEHPVTLTTRVLSVWDVWKDFIAGKYAGRGFIVWIMLSILVDVAAFIFFALAFRKTDD